jgi:hypothetical protein
MLDFASLKKIKYKHKQECFPGASQISALRRCFMERFSRILSATMPVQLGIAASMIF